MCEAFWDNVMNGVKRIAQPTIGFGKQASDFREPFISVLWGQKTLHDMSELNLLVSLI